VVPRPPTSVSRFAKRDGGWVWLECRAIAVVAEQVAYVSARDVTDRKAAEASLEASERRAARALETAPDAFVSLDDAGLITGWNARAESVFGWSRDEVIGREMADCLIPEADREDHRRQIERFVATGTGRLPGRRQEVMMLHRNGYEFLAEMTMSAVETTDGYSFTAFLRDVTERRRAEAELALARDQALDASRMKSMFVANMSHEIRTPMNGVIGMTELLLDTELDDEQREYVEAISSSGDALLTLIDDILDLSKVEAGKLELDPTVFYVRDAIAQACGMLAGRAREKGVELVIAVESLPPGPVRGDGARLRQVITNFVSNAVKFTAHGEVVVRLSSRPTDDAGRVLVRVAVTDTGIGIEPRALRHLFKPFQQADSSTTRKYGGSGLGLAISRHLIELMGGLVGADSKPGLGSTFWLELPLDRAEVADTPDDARGLPGLRILVVSDEDRADPGGGAVERNLRAWRTACNVTHDAAGAVDVMESASRSGLAYELVVLDLAAAGDAYDLARAVRSRPALTGVHLIMLVPPGAPAGGDAAVDVDRLLTRPVEPGALHDEIEAVLAGRPASAPRADRPVHAGRRPASAGPRPLVLVVEDTPVNQAVATRMLSKRGYRTDVAENGRRALEALSTRAYAAILMDCQMPELDGFETTRAIRRLERDGRPRTPIIAMTASTMQGERERCLEAGMDDYLTKPLRSLTLRPVLARWIPEGAADQGDALDPVGVVRQDGTVVGRAASSAAGPLELLDEAILAELETLGDGVLDGLVPLYVEDASARVSELAAAAVAGDAPTVARTAHRLKGSSRSVGAAVMGAIAGDLETRAKAGDLGGADALVAALERSLAETATAFEQRSAAGRTAGSGRA
jgi:PAS domain S-box-containing protein